MLVFPLLFVLSCGEEQSATNTQSFSSNVPLRITINTPETEDTTNSQTTQLEDFLEFVTTISIIVQGNDFSTISESFARGQQIVVFVLPGDDRTFFVSLLNSEGQPVCSGQTTTDIVAGEPNEISIDCFVADEVCDDDSDNNGNGLEDCEEDVCTGAQCDGTNINICIDGVCSEPPPPTPDTEENCTDGIDNDEDEGEVNGGTDCTDLDCAFDTACAEICDNGVDDPDADGLVNGDCLDDTCDGEPCDPENEDFICIENECTTEGEVDCDNGIDDDGDDLVDCDDLDDCVGLVCFNGDDGSACVIVPTEGEPIGQCQEVACSDGNNNDGDFLFGEFEATDCADPDCEGEACGTGSGAECDFFGEGGECIEVNCFDQNDNDLDESTDCDDANDCGFFNRPCGTGAAGAGANCEDDGGQTFTFECQENACSNGEDDDRDELTDCADPDCDFSGEGGFCESGGGTGAACSFIDQGQCDEINCDDGIDNDGNEGIDCADPDCATAQNCGQQLTESICDDGIDNDGNEGADCADPDCNAMGCGTGQACFNMECQEVLCTDDVDNDDDGFTDCDDLNCQSRPCEDPQSLGARCSLGGMGEGVGNGTCIERFCGDGIDNDMDGDGQTLIDCLDPDCNGTQCGSQFLSGSSCSNMVCTEVGSGCSDGNDNDDDGDIDCVDTDCPCPQGSVCNLQTGQCET